MVIWQQGNEGHSKILAQQLLILLICFLLRLCNWIGHFTRWGNWRLKSACHLPVRSPVGCLLSSLFICLSFSILSCFPEVKFHAWNWQGSRARVSSLEGPSRVKKVGGNESGLGIFLDFPPFWSISGGYILYSQPHTLQVADCLYIFSLRNLETVSVCRRQVVLSFAHSRTWVLHCSLVKSVYQNIILWYLRVLAVMILHAKILDFKYTIFLKNSSKFTHVPT